MKPKDNIAPIRDLLKPISANDLFDFDFLPIAEKTIPNTPTASPKEITQKVGMAIVPKICPTLAKLLQGPLSASSFTSSSIISITLSAR